MKSEDLLIELQAAFFQPLFMEDRHDDLIFETEDSVLIKREKEELINSFWDSGLEVWINSNRAVVFKEYQSFSYFRDSWRKDQIVISNLLNYLPLRFKNSLYFLIIYNWSKVAGQEEQIESNFAEKDAKYCRKYIIRDVSDFDRIPFFRQRVLKAEEEFPYEQKFVQKLISKNDHFEESIIQIINDYFQPGVHSLINNNEKVKIKKLISARIGDDVVDNKSSGN
jgi:hypothetical protein